MSLRMTRHFISCSLAYSYCSVRLGSGFGTNSACLHRQSISTKKELNQHIIVQLIFKQIFLSRTLMFSSQSSATNSIRSSSRPPPPLEQTRILTLSSTLQQQETGKLSLRKDNSSVKDLMPN